MNQFDLFRTDKKNIVEVEHVDRRKKPDIWKRITFYISLIGWILISVILTFLFKATPESENFFSRHWQVQARVNWDHEMIAFGFYTAFVLLGLSLINIVIDLLRNKRKQDKINYFNLVSLMLSIIFIALYAFVIM